LVLASVLASESGLESASVWALVSESASALGLELALA
jgi:hypothetical protein